MSLNTAAKIKLLSEAKDYKATVLKEVGDLSKEKVFANRILVAIHFRPEKVSGIIRPQSNVEEDAYQSKLGLVLKKGPLAFIENGERMVDNVEVGDFILYRASDGFPVSKNGVPCRVLKDEQIMMQVNNPEDWF